MNFGNLLLRDSTLLRRPIWSALKCPIPCTHASKAPSVVLPTTFVRTITKHRVRVLREMKVRSESFDLAPHKLRARNEWPDWNYAAELFAFNKRLSENWTEFSLQVAFTHSSYVNVEKNRREQLQLANEHFHIDHNQKFIEQGQSQLNDFLPKYLRYHLRLMPEEGINSIKDFLISEKTLSHVCSAIGCNDLILSEDFPFKRETKANTVKALVGASLADNGDTHTNNFIIDFIATYLQSVDLLEVWNIEEPIKVLQQILNNNHLNEPEARLLRETGMNTLIPCFLVGHYVDKQLLGSSAGNTIEQATEMSAYESLRRIFGLTSAQTIFKYGKDAYDLNYQAFAQTNASLQDWTIGEKGLQTQKNVAQ